VGADQRDDIASFLRRCFFQGSQHHLASVAGGVWQLAQRVEAVLAAESEGRFRGDARPFGGNERHRSPVQMVDSTIVRAHVSAAGAKGGRKGKLSVAHV
jgi:hypothetical protein